MPKYDKYGISRQGEPNKLRKQVGNIMHMFSIGMPGVNREMADDLYRAMKTGKDVGGWNVSGFGKGGGGKDDAKGDGGNDNVKKVRPTFNDVNFSMKGEFRKKPIYTEKRTSPLPDVPKKIPDIPSEVPDVPDVIPDVPGKIPRVPSGKNMTMKAGGLVRGAGKAERGRGRGKMV